MASSNQSINKVFKELAALDQKLAKKIVRKAHRDGAKIIAAEIKSQAPTASGETKRSVKVKAGKRKKGFIVTNIVIGGHPEDPMIGQVEFGNSRQAANPFIRRSVASKQEECVNKIADVIGDGIKNVK